MADNPSHFAQLTCISSKLVMQFVLMNHDTVNCNTYWKVHG